jgi:hypothetical protein
MDYDPWSVRQHRPHRLHSALSLRDGSKKEGISPAPLPLSAPTMLTVLTVSSLVLILVPLRPSRENVI